MSYNGPRLRPMTAGDIVDEAIGLYRRNFRIFLIIGAFVVVPLGVVQVFLSLVGNQDDLAFLAFSGLATTALSGLVYAVLWAVMARASASLFLLDPIDERRAFSHISTRIGPILLLAILYGVTVTMLTFVFLIGIYFAIAWLFAMHVMLIEGHGIGTSLTRSRALVSGHWWRVFGIGLIAVIVQGVIVTALSLPSIIAGGSAMVNDPFAQQSTLANVLATIGNAAGVIVAGPIIFCTVTLLYFDLRIRKEGFDLEYQIREMEASLPQTLTTPASASPAEQRF